MVGLGRKATHDLFYYCSINKLMYTKHKPSGISILDLSITVQMASNQISSLLTPLSGFPLVQTLQVFFITILLWLLFEGGDTCVIMTAQKVS